MNDRQPFDPPVDLPHLIDQMRRQAALHAQLEELAERQHDLVTRDDVTPLLAILAQRQRVVTELAQIAQRLAPMRQDWKCLREQLPHDQRVEVEELLDASQGSLERIINADQRDAHLLSARKTRIASLLGDLSRGGTAMSAYKSPSAEARRVNLVSEDA